MTYFRTLTHRFTIYILVTITLFRQYQIGHYFNTVYPYGFPFSISRHIEVKHRHVTELSSEITMASFVNERLYHDIAIVITASKGHLKLLLNWIASFQKTVDVKMRNSFILVSLDQNMNKELRHRNISFLTVEKFLPMSKNVSSDEVLYNSSAYNRLTNVKIQIVLYFLKTFSISVLFSDVDVVILNEKGLLEILLLMNTSTYDLFFTSDNFLKPKSSICTGFYAAKSSEFSRRFLESVHDMSK
jgi:Nucleotide-diphospho-sugar transferase